MSTTANALLDFTDLPRFDVFQPDQIRPAIESLIAQARRVLAELGQRRFALGSSHRTTGPRLGHGQPPQCRGR
jgi:Zn-dependent oligopeptidase